jgi:hypothetical protein
MSREEVHGQLEAECKSDSVVMFEVGWRWQEPRLLTDDTRRGTNVTF